MIIEPTVGRVVWYWPDQFDKDQAGMVHDGVLPLDAHVVYVHSSRMVNLVVFDHNGNMYQRTSVTLVQEEDTPLLGRYCQWMPYQVGQAKKHEGDGK